MLLPEAGLGTVHGINPSLQPVSCRPSAPGGKTLPLSDASLRPPRAAGTAKGAKGVVLRRGPVWALTLGQEEGAGQSTVRRQESR